MKLFSKLLYLSTGPNEAEGKNPAYAANDKKLLVIKDEYADCFIPFLTQHYSEIAVISGKCRLSDYSGIINPDEYAQTFFLFGADNLTDKNCIAS